MELMDNVIDRLIDLSSIPTRQADGKYLWINATGCKCKFEYKGHSGELEILGYNHNTYKVIILYNNIVREVGAVQLRKASLGVLFGEAVKEYKLKVGDILHNGKSDLLIIELTRKGPTSRKAYKYKCLTCGLEGEAVESDLLRKDNRTPQGCLACNGTRLVKGVNDIKTTHTWMLPYFINLEDASNYTFSSKHVLQMLCPHCKALKEFSPASLSKIGYLPCECLCKISLPEHFMISILKLFNIKYITLYCNKHLEWIGKYKYDFYLTDYNIIIETHGAQHYRLTKLTKITVEELLNIDKLKRELALSNNISNYYEIDCSASDNVQKWINDCEEKGLFKLLGINKLDIDKDSISVKQSEIEIINDMELYMSLQPKPKRLEILDHFGISRHVYDRYRRFINKRNELKNGIDKIQSL